MSILPRKDAENKNVVVIVDDDQETRAMYAEAFRRAGVTVYTAVDGLEGLNVIQRIIPDMVFTGILMPRMDGFTLLETLKQDTKTKDIPVVINSHLGRPADQDRAEKLGAKAFIVRDMMPLADIVAQVKTYCCDSERFVVEIVPSARDAQRLATVMGADEGFLCENGRKMVLSFRLVDTKKQTIEGNFECIE